MSRMFCFEWNQFYYELYIRKKLKYKIESICHNNNKTQTKLKVELHISVLLMKPMKTKY
jgi:hypothetical protein